LGEALAVLVDTGAAGADRSTVTRVTTWGRAAFTRGPRRTWPVRRA